MKYAFSPPWEEELLELKEKGVKFLTVQDVSYMLNISQTSVKRAIYSGELDAFKFLDAWVVYIESLIEYSKKRYNLNN